MISTINVRRLAAVLVLSGLFAFVGTAGAQVPAPPPGPGGAGVGQPAPPPPPGGAVTGAGGFGVDPAKAQEVDGYLNNGKNAMGQLDLASAQMYFEQAFAKCDQYGIKGPLQAKIYMALGALFSGYLHQVPQGTEFMKMALGIDPSIRPEPSMINETVNATFATVAASMGIMAAPGATGTPGAGAPTGAPAGAGHFWIMKHNRVTSAKRMHPLGLWVDTNPMVAIQAVRLYFRLPSDSNYQGTNMQQNGSMFGMVINCDAIALLDPESIFYYIEVIGGDGTVVANEGSPESPVQLSMFKEEAFRGEQPFLPGMEPLPACNPDEAAPCPPWDPHCHDMACVTSEDCLGGKCHEGYCMYTSGDESETETEYVGVSLALTFGTGFGIVKGTEPAFEENELIDLESGFSSSTMFARFRGGYFILDSLLVGAMVRYQIPVFVGGAKDDGDYKAGGLLFGVDAAWFLYGGDEFGMGKGQVVEDDGTLAEKPGLRWYARVEFDIYGAIYHSVVVKGYDPASTNTVKENRVHASGMSGVGLGSGILYGFNKHLDLTAELMYDYMFPKETSAHNFDVHLGLNVHF